MTNIEHWMSFSTFAEQRFFTYPTGDTYTGIIISGNMACHAPSGMAKFLLEKTAQNTSYIINPLTHAFQHDPSVVKSPSTNEVKTSIQKLANLLGQPISDVVGNSPLLPEHIKNHIKEFVSRCLDFQKNQLSSAMKNSDVVKYLGDNISNLTPSAVISPYFYMTETTLSDWLDINLECARLAVQHEVTSGSNIDVFAAVIVSQGIISDHDLIDEIINKFEGIDVKGFLIWVDNLNEQKAGGVELKGLLKLARGLRKNNTRKVINLHGGFFSILSGSEFGKFSMTGVAHGPEFGEHRSVVPVGGGIPIAKYYVRELHSRMKYQESLSLLQGLGWLSDPATYFTKVCGCPECKKVINSDINNFTLFGEANLKEIKKRERSLFIEYPTKETKERCLKHYLNCKKHEYEIASEKTPSEIRELLSSARNTFKDKLGLTSVAYLDLWKNIFES